MSLPLQVFRPLNRAASTTEVSVGSAPVAAPLLGAPHGQAFQVLITVGGSLAQATDTVYFAQVQPGLNNSGASVAVPVAGVSPGGVPIMVGREMIITCEPGTTQLEFIANNAGPFPVYLTVGSVDR